MLFCVKLWKAVQARNCCTTPAHTLHSHPQSFIHVLYSWKYPKRTLNNNSTSVRRDLPRCIKTNVHITNRLPESVSEKKKIVSESAHRLCPVWQTVSNPVVVFETLITYSSQNSEPSDCEASTLPQLWAGRDANLCSPVYTSTLIEMWFTDIKIDPHCLHCF